MKKIYAVFFLFWLLQGCHRESSSPIFVIVNGQPITAKHVEEQVRVQAKILELSGKPINEGDFLEWGNQMAVSVLQTLLSSTLIQQSLAARGLVPEQEDFEKVLAEYNKKLDRAYGDTDSLAAQFGEFDIAFKKLLEMEVAVSFYERKFWIAKVTDQMLSQRLNAISNLQAKAVQINERSWSAANEAYVRLKRGESWKDVAKAYSEDKVINPSQEKYATRWLSVGPTAVGIKPLARKLPAMKSGDFTEPIETNEGLMIVRLEGETNDIYRLSRIFFRMGRNISMPKDADEARKDFENELLLTNRQNTLAALWKHARLEYPMGTNFTYSIWREK